MRPLFTQFSTLFLFFISTISIGNASELSTIGNCLNSISNQQNTDIISHKVSIEYITHSTFEITSPKGIKIVTNFTGISDNTAPNIITQNHKSTKSSKNKNTIIVETWSTKTNTPLQHVVIKGDVAIRNFQVDLYKNGELKTPKANSIFIFKIAGLCIAHLGNIQHALNDEQLKSIQGFDIVMTPVSGRDKFKTQELADLLIALKAKIIIPMHWNSDTEKQIFMADMSSFFSIAGYPTDALKVSTKTLPKTPTIVTMIPQYEQTEAEFNKHH